MINIENNYKNGTKNRIEKAIKKIGTKVNAVIKTAQSFWWYEENECFGRYEIVFYGNDEIAICPLIFEDIDEDTFTTDDLFKLQKMVSENTKANLRPIGFIGMHKPGETKYAYTCIMHPYMGNELLESILNETVAEYAKLEKYKFSDSAYTQLCLEGLYAQKQYGL